jgi:hypothetical protein
MSSNISASVEYADSGTLYGASAFGVLPPL